VREPTVELRGEPVPDALREFRVGLQRGSGVDLVQHALQLGVAQAQRRRGEQRVVDLVDAARIQAVAVEILDQFIVGNGLHRGHRNG